MRDLREDEFIGEDGLIYCKACGSARQMKVELFGKQDTVFCLCRCRTEKRDREDEEYHSQARKAEIQQIKSDGLQDAALQRCTFANDLGYQPESAKLRSYVEQFPAMRKRGAGLLLWGDVGTGKTFLAACVANALLDQGILVRMPVTGELLNKLMGIYPSERNAFLERTNSGDMDICMCHPWTTAIAYFNMRGSTSEYDNFGPGFGVNDKFPEYLQTALAASRL